MEAFYFKTSVLANCFFEYRELAGRGLEIKKFYSSFAWTLGNFYYSHPN